MGNVEFISATVYPASPLGDLFRVLCGFGRAGKAHTYILGELLMGSDLSPKP